MDQPDYAGASDAANDAYELIRRFIELGGQIREITLPFLEPDGIQQTDLVALTREFADLRSDAEAIVARLDEFRVPIAHAYEEVNAEAESLHLVARLCVKLADRAEQLLDTSDPISWPEWRVFGIKANVFTSEEVRGDGLPSVRDCCSMCEAVAIASARLSARAADSIQDSIPPEDGPWDGRWVHDGQVTDDAMIHKAWLMVNYLWNETRSKSCQFKDLAYPVYGDRVHDTSGDAIPSLRKKANNYFRDHGIHFHVTTEGGNHEGSYVHLKAGAPKPIIKRK